MTLKLVISIRKEVKQQKNNKNKCCKDVTWFLCKTGITTGSQ